MARAGVRAGEEAEGVEGAGLPEAGDLAGKGSFGSDPRESVSWTNLNLSVQSEKKHRQHLSRSSNYILAVTHPNYPVPVVVCR